MHVTLKSPGDGWSVPGGRCRLVVLAVVFGAVGAGWVLAVPGWLLPATGDQPRMATGSESIPRRTTLVL